VSHKLEVIGQVGYLAKYGKCKEWKVVQNHVFTVSGVEFFYLGRAVTVQRVKFTAMFQRHDSGRMCFHSRGSGGKKTQMPEET
jgi:hypothetical protein